MRRWLARAFAGTIGCGTISLLAFLLAALLAAGGDARGAGIVRVAAQVLAIATGAGLVGLVLLLSTWTLQQKNSATPFSKESKPS